MTSLISLLPYLVVIFVTGLCSLIYQVVWQKYLSVLIGSEAKSSSLIVGVFLAGLALGYFVWGRMTLRAASRRQLLKSYGAIEFFTGAYAVLFPLIFEWALPISKGLPNWFASDLLICVVLILPPTFLMGATIPMMTCCLPKSFGEVNNLHAKIYGLNTLGAFLGTLLGGFWLVPYLGLPLSMTVAGGLNIAVSLVYLGNRLEGTIQKPGPTPSVENPLSGCQIYWLVFCSGLVCISLEILWFRLWGLTIGNSAIVFPMVLSLFVLGLGYGSLNIRDLSYRGFRRQLIWFLVAAAFSYGMVTYLPRWITHLRVLFVVGSQTYVLFYVLSYLVLAAVLLPVVIPLGRLLPMGYAFLQKGQGDYGERCGVLYFVNTLGTFFGAVVLSYLCLTFLNVNHLYIINVLIFLAVYVSFILLKEKRDNQIVFVVCLAVFMALFPWNRDIHVWGNFRERVRGERHLRSPWAQFELKKNRDLALTDGPNTTVAVMENPEKNGEVSRSIMVGGKSDSSTGEDFSTTSLLALIPYLSQYHRGEELRASVVGLGTGVTVGVLAQLQRVSEVDLLEISPAVAEMNHFFDEANYRALKNPKVKTHIIDAFKHYIKSDKKYHMIISEPTNPWVVGVENLYTPYFYELARESLAPGGVFAQWLQTYSIDRSIFNTMIGNMSQHFPHMRAYKTSSGDLLILGRVEGPAQLALGARVMESADGDFISKLLQKSAIPQLPLLSYLEVLSPQDCFLAYQLGKRFDHGIFNPTLSFKALRTFYLGQGVNHLDLLNDAYVRQVGNSSRLPLLKKMSVSMGQNPKYCKQAIKKLGTSPLCAIYKKDLDNYNLFLKRKLTPNTLNAYHFLRNRGLIEGDRDFLLQVRRQLIAKVMRKQLSTKDFLARIKQVWVQMEADGLWREMFQNINQLHALGLVDQQQHRSILDFRLKRKREIISNLQKISVYFKSLKQGSM